MLAFRNPSKWVPENFHGNTSKLCAYDSRKRTMCISKKEFTDWSKTAREKRKLCEEGQISLEKFQAWLDESKCR